MDARQEQAQQDDAEHWSRSRHLQSAGADVDHHRPHRLHKHGRYVPPYRGQQPPHNAASMYKQPYQNENAPPGGYYMNKSLATSKRQGWSHHHHPGTPDAILKARRTIYICDIDPEVTEANLARLFQPCGSVIDCRLCSDSNSILRFAFLEFAEVQSVELALKQVNGFLLGKHRVRVVRSNTGMKLINSNYLPKSASERERCLRTIYVSNVDAAVDEADVRRFFEKFCGSIMQVCLTSGKYGSKLIAFIEFSEASCATAALSLSGALLGTLPIRVAPSKTPVRSEASVAERWRPAHQITPLQQRRIAPNQLKED